MNRETKADDPSLYAALDALFSHLTSAREGEWDTIVIESGSHADAVASLALRHAMTMDFEYRMSPGSRDGVEIRFHRGGRRSAIEEASLQAVRALQPRGLFRAILLRIGRAARRSAAKGARDLVLAIDLPPGRAVSSTVPNLIFVEASAEEIARRPRRYASYGTDTEVRLARGDRCVIALLDGEVICRNWISFDPDLIARRCAGAPVGSGAAYVYDCHTVPEWRGRSVQAAALGWIGGWASERASRLLLSIAPDNVGSLRAARKVGFAVLPDATPGGVRG